MKQRLGERGLRVGVAAIAALAAIGMIIGYIGLGPPFKVAGIVLAIGIGIWNVRGEKASAHILFPDPWKVALVLSVAGLAGFAWAWQEERHASTTLFEFRVVPKQLTALESVAPEPNTETFAAPQHQYGSHVVVDCSARGTDGRTWYRLDDGNFMPSKELVPAPLSGEAITATPPMC